MCTISLVFNSEENTGFILTSNRDEAPGRETISPDFYTVNNTRLLFPKDAVAGGTWIGVSANKRVVCLMNGGFEKHIRASNYRVSRGVVVKDILAAEDPLLEINSYNFQGIEPFTLILADWKQELLFYELVWDGNKAHLKKLRLKNYIWSSSPLYSSEMKGLREAWFEELQQKKNLTSGNVWDFHHSAGIGNKEIDLVMDRGFIKTKSITQIIKTSEKTRMIYEDLQKGKIYEAVF
ncbi:NRDE family protein [Gillisia limnaea]|uniref:Transport and Golgi organization protein 2 n=1 Tax=Gillisia limnaea (strain DSM 15749 / LMG 21470 / R-8282) TaxID=865937 RepID=H2BX35_GILLR|nr:NRDE family protein [Gillisia limnaea]EHQ01987.1 hypothetical protein Gilli_1321 [Gillisia limnaea DSM 15749]